MARKKLVAAAMTASILAGGIVGAALFTPVLSGAQETTDDSAAEVEDAGGDGVHRGFRHHGPYGGGLALDVAAETLGMTEDELRDALEDGQTIAQVAEAQGVPVQDVIDALVAAATERIDERVAEIKENLPERMTDLVNGELRFRRGPRAGLHKGVALDVAAEAIGITEDDLRDAIEGGDSIADVAEANGVDVQEVIDALVARATERIDQAVADGDIDADEAEEKKANLTERISQLVERDGPFLAGPRHRFGPRGG